MTRIQKISFPFPDIRDEQIEKMLLPVAKKVFIPAKTILLHPNDELTGMYYIHSGSTRHYAANMDGIEKIIYVLSPGWLFGEPSYMMNYKTGLYCTAETDLELWIIPYDQVERLLGCSSDIRDLMLNCLTYKVLFLRHETENLCFNSCEDRLLRTICMCTDQSSLIDGQWYNLKIQYTHYELSILIGSVRVTVSRLINKLCDDGVLRLVNHKIQINQKAYKNCIHQFFEQYLL